MIKRNGFTLIEMLVVVTIIGIVVFISTIVYSNLNEKSSLSYYTSLEKTVSLSGKNYFTDNKDLSDVKEENGSIVFLNPSSNRFDSSSTYLVDDGYLNDVVDQKGNACIGYVVSYYDINSRLNYKTCLKCNDEYESHGICDVCDESMEYDDINDVYLCKVSDTVYEKPQVAIKYTSGDSLGGAYDGEWTRENLQLTYTVTSSDLKKLVVAKKSNNIINSALSCDFYNNKCSVEITNSEYNAETFVAYALNERGESSPLSNNFTLRIDRTSPECTNSGDSTVWTGDNRIINYGCSDSVGECDSLYSGSSITFSTTTKTSIIPEYIIKDKVGNTTTCPSRTASVYVDKTGPECTNSGGSTTWINGSRIVYYGCSDSDSLCDSSYSGGSKTFSTTTRRATIPSYTIKDNVGNTTTCPARVANVYVDKTRPECTNSGDSTVWTGDNRIINYGCSDSDSLCDSSYSGSFETFSTTTKFGVIPSYTIKDNAGNITTCPVRTASVYVDKTGPECTSSGDSTVWTGDNRTITYGCSDSDSLCDSSFSGGSKTFSTTTETSLINAYTIKDNAGNTTSCPARVANVYVMKSAPECTNSGDSTTWTNGNRTIYYGCSTISGECDSSYSGGSITFSTTTKTSVIPEYTIKDTYGNTTVCPARVANVYVDKTGPECTSSGDSTSWTSANRTITYGCSDSDSFCDSSYSGGSKTFSTTTETSLINAYTIKDNAGNTTSCPARVANVYVMKSGPECTSSGDSTTWTNGNRTIYYGCSTMSGECDSSYSGGSITFSTTTKTSVIPEYTIKDTYGNTTVCPARVANVYVDKTGPECTSSGDSTSWTNSSRTIYYGCSDSDSLCDSSFSGSSLTFSTTTKFGTISSYTIKDNAGNTTTCPVRSANVYVDKTGPVCTSSGDSTSWTNGSRRINYGCSDPDSLCDSSFSGGSETFSTTTKFGTISSYTIKDNVGNTTSCPSRVANVYVDRIAPGGSIVLTGNMSGGIYNSSVVAKFEFTDADSKIDTVRYCRTIDSSTCSPNILIDNNDTITINESGNFVIRAMFDDNAGNINGYDKFFEIQIPVSIEIDDSGSLGTNGWYTSNVTSTFDVNDPSDRISSLKYCVSQGAGSTCVPNISTSDGGSVSITNEGINIIHAEATLNTGNPLSISNVIKIDKTGPECTNSGDSTSWTSGNRTITYGCSDSGSLCNSSYSGSSETFSTTTKFSTISSYTIKDNAGNATSCPSRVASIYVDKTGPECTSSGDSTTWTSANRTITYGCSDSDSLCNSSYSGSSETFSTTTKSSTISSYTIKDNAGNTTSCPSRVANIYVDKTGPTCSITINSNASSSGVNYSVSGSDSDSNALLYNSSGSSVLSPYSVTGATANASYYALNGASSRSDCSITISSSTACPSGYTEISNQCLKYSCDPSWTEWEDVSSTFVQNTPSSWPTRNTSTTQFAYDYYYNDDYDTCNFYGGFTNPCYEKITYKRYYLCPVGLSKVDNKCYYKSSYVTVYTGVVD